MTESSRLMTQKKTKPRKTHGDLIYLLEKDDPFSHMCGINSSPPLPAAHSSQWSDAVWNSGALPLPAESCGQTINTRTLSTDTLIILTAVFSVDLLADWTLSSADVQLQNWLLMKPEKYS